MEIRDFDHALELAREFEVDGAESFRSKYSEEGPNRLIDFFGNFFAGQDRAKARRFSENLFKLSSGFGIDFFYALKSVGELPQNFEPHLNKKVEKTKKVLVLTLLRGFKPDLEGDGLLPSEILPRGIHDKPLSEQVAVIGRAYNWALRNVSMAKLTALRKNLVELRKRGMIISKNAIPSLDSFIAVKKRLLMRQKKSGVLARQKLKRKSKKRIVGGAKK